MAAKKRSGPFVIAYGAEDYLLDRVIELGRSWKDRAIVFLDGDGLADHEVVSFCEQGSLDGRDRVVVVDNAHGLKGDKAISAFVSGKNPEDDSVIVVAVLRTDKLSDVWKAAAAKGRLEHYPKFKPWETKEISARIVQEASRRKLLLEEDIPELFLKLLGDDLRRTANELQKLSFVVEKGSRVTKKDVAAVIAPDVPVEPYEVAAAATAKDVRKALRLISTLFKNLGEPASVPITAGLVRQIEKLIVARQMLDKGDEPKVIASRLGMHPFLLQKEILPRARKYTVSQLRDQMNKLCKLDAQVKGAARSKRTLVELAVLSIAA